MKKVLSPILPAVVLSLTIGAAAAEPGPMSFGIWHVRFAAPAAKKKPAHPKNKHLGSGDDW